MEAYFCNIYIVLCIIWSSHTDVGKYRRVSDDIYSRNASCALNNISTFLFNYAFSLSSTNVRALPEHQRHSRMFSGVRVTQSLVFCVVFFRPFFVFSPFSLLLGHSTDRFIASDYPYGIFKPCLMIRDIVSFF